MVEPLNQVTKIGILPVPRLYRHNVPSCYALKKDIPPYGSNAWPQYNHAKITQIKIKELLQNTTPVPFKIQVHKNQGKTEELSQTGGDQGIKTTQVSMWNSGLDCRRKKPLVRKPIQSKLTLLFSESIVLI